MDKCSFPKSKALILTNKLYWLTIPACEEFHTRAINRMRLASYLILQYTNMHNQIRKHCMTLFTSNRFDASLPYWLEMISDWSLYHLSPPRKLSASRSLTSSSERSSSGRSGQRGWSSPTKAAHWKREEMVEHIFAKMLDIFIQCLWRNEPSVSQKAIDGIII